MTTSNWDGKRETDTSTRPEEPPPALVSPSGTPADSHHHQTPTHPTSDDYRTPAKDSSSATRDEELPAEPLAREIADQMRHRLSVHLRDRQRALEHGTAGSPLTIPSYPDRAVQRPVAVTIYLSDDNGHQGVQQALSDLLHAFDLELVESLPPVRGSWYRTFVARTRRAVTSPELTSRLQKVERGVELHLLHKQQAEIDSMQGQTVAQLLTALERTSSALIQIGSVLIVKVNGVPVVRNLTQHELAHLERNPTLLKSPDTILEALQHATLHSPQLSTAALVDHEP